MSFSSATLLATWFSLSLVCSARAEDWPQWMGPRGDGIWTEKGILAKFPKDGAKVLWRAPLGPGYTGPAVVGDRVYVMDRTAGKPEPRKPGEQGMRAIPGTERVLCLDAKTGKELWKHEYDCTYRIADPVGPRATPLVQDGKVFTLGAMGDLLCLDATRGTVIWKLNFVQDLKAPVPVWGWAAHPVLDGDRLICLVGGENSVVVALDRRTGKVLWKALKSEEVGYAPPILIEASGKRQLVVLHSDAVNGLDPVTGAVYWTQTYPLSGKPQRPAVPIASPRYENGLLYVSSFYHGSLTLRLASDKPAVSVVWKSKRENPQNPDALHACMGTPLVVDGHIYGFCGFGQLRCLDFASGKQQWEDLQAATPGRETFLATAFMVKNADRFFIFNDQGDLIIAQLTPKGYTEMDRAHLIDPVLESRGRMVVWAHPAFANKCCFVRNTKEIVCVSLAG